MDLAGGLMKEFGMNALTGGGKSKGKGKAKQDHTSTAGKYILTAFIVPWIFSKVIKPLRMQARVFLGRHLKRGLRQSGKKSMRAQVCTLLLKHLDTLTRKETLFAFWFALLVFLKSVMPHFKVAMKTLVRRLK